MIEFIAHKALLKFIFKKSIKVKGGALYYAIFVMLLLSMIGLLTISYFQLSFNEDMLFYKQAELNDNLNSAITKICCQPDILKESNELVLDVFDDGQSLVDVKINRWGFLQKLTVKANWRQLGKEKTVLVAEQEKERPALWMPDKKRYVSLVGNSYINGNCHLSELGLRKGNAEGRYFEGPYLHQGHLKRSSETMPVIKEELRTYYERYYTGQLGTQDSIVSYHNLSNKKQIYQSFSDKTLFVQSSGRLVLDQGRFMNNIILFSPDTIEVWPGVELNNVQLIAKSIIIKQGFKGKMQAVASNSMLIEKSCQLNYPSLIGVISQVPNATIAIKEGTKINGGVICYSQRPKEGETKLKVDQNCLLVGKVYVNGDMDFKGQVIGSLYCDRFVHMTSRAFYENFMIDCSIDEGKLPDTYASFCITDEINKYKEVAGW